MDAGDDIPNYAKVAFNFTVLIVIALVWNIVGPWAFDRSEGDCFQDCAGRSVPTVPAAAFLVAIIVLGVCTVLTDGWARGQIGLERDDSLPPGSGANAWRCPLGRERATCRPDET